MPTPPTLSGRDAAKVFQKFGWRIARSGNHIVMVKDGSLASLSIPDHKAVAKGTLRSLIRAANLTVDEFSEASRKL